MSKKATYVNEWRCASCGHSEQRDLGTFKKKCPKCGKPMSMFVTKTADKTTKTVESKTASDTEKTAEETVELKKIEG
jgi:predicted ATP-dependent serine protease